MELTKQNYFSDEANHHFMSVSQFETWKDCQSRAYAQYVKHEYSQPGSEAFLLGSFIHTLSEGQQAFNDYCEEHPELFYKSGKNAGEFKEKTQQALKAWERAMESKVFSEYMQGEKEKLFTAHWCGVDWRILVDVYNEDRCFASDLKYIKSIKEKHWKKFYIDLNGNVIDEDKAHREEHTVKNLQVSFIEKYDYWLRTAIYQKVLEIATGKRFEMFLPTITKESPCDFEVFSMNNQWRLDYEVQRVERYMPEIIRARESGYCLHACGDCDYCRASKKLFGVVEAESIF